MQDLDALDVLRIVAVPKEANCFALPTQDRPGRIVSQQRRALTIAHALVREWLTRDRRRLAVIGGGFGGIAAALYAASEGIQVDLFETETELLSRFSKSSRYVDPRIGD
jgi:NADPH-dependent 2,4-dienoyl-CoA reductase/sulfur reductase-like enzyme